MRIFISWSGNLSHRVALILRDWLPNVIQIVDPYVSSEDIDKGTRWASDISKELAGASLGIICLTRTNLAAPWILFEAGALSKSIERSRVVPLLVDVSPSDIEGPLVQFQASSILEDDIRKMVKDINTSMGEQAVDPRRIEASFQKWWPDLDRSLQEAKASQVIDSRVATVVRSERELLEETLELARQISKSTGGDFETRMRLEIKALFSRSALFQPQSDDSRAMLEELAAEFYRLISRYEQFRNENNILINRSKELEIRLMHAEDRLQHEEMANIDLKRELTKCERDLQAEKRAKI